MPQLSRFHNGGFVLHKIIFAGKAYSAWFNRAGSLLACEQTATKTEHGWLPCERAVPLRAGLIRGHLQTVGLRYVEQPRLTIEGKYIEEDKSGIGHCWLPADLDTPSNIVEEIAAEIINGRVNFTTKYMAGNGVNYRW